MTPSITPGEIAGWPLLKLVYRTDPDKIADLLPPGIEPGAEPARPREHLQRAGEGRTGVRRVHQGGGELRRPGRLLRHRAGHRPGVGDLHQPGDQRPAEVPVLDRLLPARRRGRGALHPPRLHVPRVPRDRHRRRRRPVGRVRRERVVDQVLTRGRRCGEELRLPAARGAGGERQRHRVRGDGRGHPGAARQPMGPVHRAAPDARAAVRASRHTDPQEPRDHARRRRSTRSRSGPTRTPSAGLAGPATGAAPAPSAEPTWPRPPPRRRRSSDARRRGRCRRRGDPRASRCRRRSLRRAAPPRCSARVGGPRTDRTGRRASR